MAGVSLAAYQIKHKSPLDISFKISNETWEAIVSVKQEVLQVHLNLGKLSKKLIKELRETFQDLEEAFKLEGVDCIYTGSTDSYQIKFIKYFGFKEVTSVGNLKIFRKEFR